MPLIDLWWPNCFPTTPTCNLDKPFRESKTILLFHFHFELSDENPQTCRNLVLEGRFRFNSMFYIIPSLTGLPTAYFQQVWGDLTDPSIVKISSPLPFSLRFWFSQIAGWGQGWNLDIILSVCQCSRIGGVPPYFSKSLSDLRTWFQTLQIRFGSGFRTCFQNVREWIRARKVWKRVATDTIALSNVETNTPEMLTKSRFLTIIGGTVALLFQLYSAKLDFPNEKPILFYLSENIFICLRVVYSSKYCVFCWKNVFYNICTCFAKDRCIVFYLSEKLCVLTAFSPIVDTPKTLF